MTPSATGGVAERLACLDQVVALGDGRLPADVLSDARRVVQQAGERLAAGDHLVVAGLLGGTGSGKSSLFNALVGRDLAPVGPVRPVTADSRAAAIGEPAAATRLMDWLDVRHRHHLQPEPGLPAGLVLLDLPDHDSVALEHALLADRFAERVDLLLWVVDPIKYAHHALYDRYLRHLTTLAGVIVVVLNRADELSAEDRARCGTDLHQRLRAEGLDGAEIITTAATTGLGVADLRRRLADETEQRRAAAERISGDLEAVAARAVAALPDSPTMDDLPLAAVTAAVARALDVPGIADRAGETYAEVARARSRSPGVAVLAVVLRPLRKLARTAVQWIPPDPDNLPAAAGRRAGGGIPADVQRALLDLGDAASAASASTYGRRVRDTAAACAEPLMAEAEVAVRAAKAPPPRRRWWRLVPVVPGLAELVALAGLLWLAGLYYEVFQLPEPPAVDTVAGPLPLPTLLLLAGLATRVVAGAVRALLVGLGARRHRRAAARTLRLAVAAAVRERVAAPLAAEFETTATLRAAIRCAAAGARR